MSGGHGAETIGFGCETKNGSRTLKLAKREKRALTREPNGAEPDFGWVDLLENNATSATTARVLLSNLKSYEEWVGTAPEMAEQLSDPRGFYDEFKEALRVRCAGAFVN
jgi:hypothetical protein